MQEQWKPIKGFENLYLISNLGKVYSIKSKKLLKSSIKYDGYSKVTLFKEGKPYYMLVHKLVAKEFIPNPENKPLVLHKKALTDGGDNSINNLYWGTQSDNMKDRVKDGRQPKNYWWSRQNPKCCRKINQYDLKHNFIKKWNSIVEASEQLGIKQQHIWRVLNKVPKRKSVHGFIFEYDK